MILIIKKDTYTKCLTIIRDKIINASTVTIKWTFVCLLKKWIS